MIGLNGIVLSAEGKPVSGAVVTFLRPDSRDLTAASLGVMRPQATTAYQTTTDASGRYRYPDAPSGTYNIFVQQGSLSGALLDTKVTSGITAQAAPVKVGPPGNISGTATLAGTSDSEGVDVFLSGTPYGAHTDREGKYSLLNVPAGTYRLVAQSAGYTKLSTSVTVTSSTTTTASSLTLPRLVTTGRVSGTVTLQGGGDASGVSITVPGTSYAASSDASGNYSLDLPAGTYTLRASAPGYTPATASVTVTVGGSVTGSNLSLSRVVVPSPAVTSLSPTTAVRGGVLTITGSNFGAVQGTSVVRVNGVEAAQYLSWSDTQLQVRTSPATPLGSVGVTVAVGQGQSAPAALQLVTVGVRPISGGYSHSLAVKSDGRVAAWGSNQYGELSVPSGLSNVAAVVAGGYHSLALKGDGTVVAWGYNSYGQTNVPSGLTNVVAVVGGGYHSLALRSDGTVVAWGFNGNGQTNVPSDLTNVVAVAAGGYYSLALKSDGTVVAWGNDFYGQTNVPSGLTNVVAVAAGDYHSLALKSDGTVVAWGYNSYGQTNVPSGLTNVVGVAGGVFHSLALKSDGTVVAWGYNGNGQTNVPSGLTNVVAVAAGAYHSLALKNDGTVVTWGSNSYSQSNVPGNLVVLVP